MITDLMIRFFSFVIRSYQYHFELDQIVENPIGFFECGILIYFGPIVVSFDQIVVHFDKIVTIFAVLAGDRVNQR